MILQLLCHVSGRKSHNSTCASNNKNLKKVNETRQLLMRSHTTVAENRKEEDAINIASLLISFKVDTSCAK
jgi:hypothetical protein